MQYEYICVLHIHVTYFPPRYVTQILKTLGAKSFSNHVSLSPPSTFFGQFEKNRDV